MIKPTIERPSSVASVSSPCRSCSRGPLLAVLLISLVVTNAEEGVRNLTNVWPTANGRPLITTAVVSSTPSNLRIAYCLALVGAPTVAMAAQHLAAISLLRQTGTKKDVLSMQSPNSILRLGDALRTLDTKVVFVSNVEGKCQSSAKKSSFRFSFSFHILRVYEQTQYDKILYLDGDLAVQTPPDRLVEAWARQGTMELRTPIGRNRVSDQKNYNTGYHALTRLRRQIVSLARGWQVPLWHRLSNVGGIFRSEQLMDQGVARVEPQGRPRHEQVYAEMGPQGGPRGALVRQ